ncbi:dihydrolipoyl dehydrogenase [Marinitoga sp. 38H-ov]|uniref:dihydrolipoyl dehydrogenase n=1 Tax=Marinitoga sp. 38H-ov TaxID=1755814 RepID=UPI0016B07A07|nr:dihydrolipoyl dehydrogenase [Marinitoga sp. 38H-ov]KAF2956992.1 dihydrolipoamide dehydrogenase [Marinitoga sp. 38H-ov]
MNYDLIVLGSGPGGYVAAIRASQLGLKTAIIEKEKVGGVCLNIGCIPSKALIHQAEIFSSIKELENMGIKVDKSEFDYKKVFEKSRKAADKLSKGVQFLLKKNKIDLIEGFGELVSKNEIKVNDKIYTAKNIILATGSKPKSIPGFDIDENQILSSNGALMMEKLPKSIAIIGSGVIGIEFGYIMNTFGVEVHIIEIMDRILPTEDLEITEFLEKVYKKRNIKIYKSTKSKILEKTENSIKLELNEKDIIKVEKVLVAVGRSPNTENIGLDKIGIELENGFVKVGDYYATNIDNIYAIGDIVKTPQLAHVASKEGEIVVEHIAGLETEKFIDLNKIPSAIYSEPQIASFGLTEEKLKELKIEYNKFSFPYRGVGKSVAIEKSDGFVKILTDKLTNEILGAHIIGAEATELIHEVLLAKNTELLPEDIAKMIHAHPTLSEGIMEAFRGIEGWAIHI